MAAHDATVAGSANCGETTLSHKRPADLPVPVVAGDAHRVSWLQLDLTARARRVSSHHLLVVRVLTSEVEDVVERREARGRVGVQRLHDLVRQPAHLREKHQKDETAAKHWNACPRTKLSVCVYLPPCVCVCVCWVGYL